MVANFFQKNKNTIYVVGGLAVIAILYYAIRNIFLNPTDGSKDYNDKENGQRSGGKITLPSGKVIENPLDEKGNIVLSAFENLTQIVEYNMLDGNIVAKEAAAQMQYVLQKNYGINCVDLSERCSQLSVLLSQNDAFVRDVQNAYKSRTGKWIEDELPQNYFTKKFACVCSNNDTVVSKLKNLH